MVLGNNLPGDMTRCLQTGALIIPAGPNENLGELVLKLVELIQEENLLSGERHEKLKTISTSLIRLVPSRRGS